MSFLKKIKFLFEVLCSLFATDEISEADIEELKQHDALELALQTFAKKLPEIKEIIIDERDRYLAHNIAAAPGTSVIAVVGAGHVPGIIDHIERPIDLEPLTALPPKSMAGTLFAWSITVAVVGIMIGGFFTSGKEATLSMLQWWILANGILAGLGAAAVLAHPLTIALSVLAAPLTSLNPMVAAGWVAGLAEASLRRPQVRDFMTLKDDIATLRGFWRNKITRVLLVVVFVNAGSSVGTFVALPMMMKYL